MKKFKIFVNKWVKFFYFDTENVDDLLNCDSTRITTNANNKVILRVFEKTFGISLRGGQVILRKKRFKCVVEYYTETSACS